MINISDQTGLLAVQGPVASKILQKITDIDLSDIKYYHFVKGRIAGLDNVLISARIDEDLIIYFHGILGIPDYKSIDKSENIKRFYDNYYPIDIYDYKGREISPNCYKHVLQHSDLNMNKIMEIIIKCLNLNKKIKI